MFTHLVFWLWFAGVVYLTAGLIGVRRELVTARGLNKLIALGPVFVAAPLVVFAAEHLVTPRDLMPIVPVWLPARLFWVYFVGCAWIAGATSLVAMKLIPIKLVRLGATLLGVMFLLIVLTIHLPNAIAHPGNLMGWNFVLRETAFAGGVWALAGSLSRNTRIRTRDWIVDDWMILFGRFAVAITVIYFGLEQVLHPQFAPGVPDTKLTPPWVPLHELWGYPVGAFLLIAGAALLINKRPRTAAASIAVLMVLIAVLLHVPLLALASDPAQMTEAINFIFDTLLFAGTALLVAGAYLERGAASSRTVKSDKTA